MAENDQSASVPAEAAAIERASHVFDPWLRFDELLIPTLAGNIALSYYNIAGDRKRQVKKRDWENVSRIIEAILTNLAFALSMNPEDPSVAVSLGASKRRLTRYDAPGFAFMPRVLEVLASYNPDQFFTLQKSRQRGIASRIVPGARFLPLEIKEERKSLGASRRFPLPRFYFAPGAETVILTRTSKDHVQRTRTRELIDYNETPDSPSVRFREEVETINAYLAAADMRMEPDGGPPVPTGCRRLQRFFSLLDGDPDDPPRFDQGGRLFGGSSGGWWQNLPKDRRGAIRLNGEPVADLDFASMFLRLAYLDAGHEPPEGDLYGGVRGLTDRRWREGVKTVTSAMLFRNTPLARLPRDLDANALPAELRGPQVRGAILEAHPLLAETFESGAGFRLMFTESQILVAAVLRLIAEDVPALPMHDGLMVPQSRREIAERCMSDAAAEVTGFRLPITRKTLGNYPPA